VKIEKTQSGYKRICSFNYEGMFYIYIHYSKNIVLHALILIFANCLSNYGENNAKCVFSIFLGVNLLLCQYTVCRFIQS